MSWMGDEAPTTQHSKITVGEDKKHCSYQCEVSGYSVALPCAVELSHSKTERERDPESSESVERQLMAVCRLTSSL